MPDVVVVGGGPAGLAAATWLARYRRSVLVLDNGEYRNRWVERSHGYLGLDPVDPSALRAAAHTDLTRYPAVDVRHVTALAVTSDSLGGWHVRTSDGAVRARRLVLATGVRDALPDVEGFFTH